MMAHHNTDQAAAILGLSRRTLENWRLAGKGPKFRKLGSRVLYSETDLIEFSEAQTRHSTSDTGEDA